MFTKKNIAIIFAMMQIVFLSFAMEQVKQVDSLRSLYNNLLQIQGEKKPRHHNIERACSMPIEFDLLLYNATETGLINQYKKMLSTEEGSTNIFAIIRPICLQLAAYMQNVYGAGLPFEYNGEGNQDKVVFGEYTNPFGKQFTITRYSFLNGLIDEIEKNDKSLQGNQHFEDTKAELKENLLQAISNAEAGIEKENSPEQILETQIKALEDVCKEAIKNNDIERIEKLNEAIKNIFINDRKSVQ